VPVVGVEGDADAGLELEQHVGEREGLDERVVDAAGQRHRRAVRPEPWQQDGELVTAEPRHEVVGAQHASQPGGDEQEQLVADPVAEGVVDLLKAVEVEDAQRKWFGASDRCLEPLVQKGSVGQAGQRVVQRAVLLHHRLPGSAVHRHERGQQQRQEPDAGLRGQHDQR
jgi:hypothetical protein